ncbi:MAG: FumA C-terminus/TtdB family hydratase beta subunit [Bacillota bacterium]
MIRHISFPLEEDKEVSLLRVGDIVYLNGTVFTMRDSAHQLLFSNADRGLTPPMNLKGAAVWHCGPVVRRDRDNWEVTSVGSTTSYRFTGVTPRLLEEFQVKAVIGKGGLGPEAIAALQRTGSVFLATVGGCAGVYAQNVRRVIAVHWAEMGLPEAVWELEVENLGALIVAIDASGDNLYGKTMEQVGRRLADIYVDLNIHPDYRYVYWPPSLPGVPQVADCFKNYNPGEE